MPYTYTCPHCDGVFVARDKGRKFCSKACFDAAQTRRSLEPNRCLGCGGEFFPGRHSEGKYCSMACYDRVRAARTVRACARCGKTFKRSVGNRNTARRCATDYCSRECYMPGHVGKQRYECQRCGRSFAAYRNNGGQTPIYCSFSCKFPDPNVVKKCDQCGKEFVRKKRGNRDDRFCSRACHHKFSGETGIEAAVRKAISSLGLLCIQEHGIGRYSLDFYLPVHGVAIEADGAYWHRSKSAHDARRDKVLAAKHGIQTIRLGEAEIQSCPDLPRLIASRLGIRC